MDTIELDPDDIKQLKTRVIDLQLEHQDLHDAIEQLQQQAYPDQIQLRRMKKRKLMLKDEITRLKSRIIPDIDA